MPSLHTPRIPYRNMQDRNVILSPIPRTLNLAPPVASVHYNTLPYSKMQVVKDFQFLIRLSGTPARFHATINGTAVTAAYPHILIKRPGDVIISEPSEKTSFYFKYTAGQFPELEKKTVLQDIILPPNILAQIQQLYDLLEHVTEYGVADRIDVLCLDLLTNLLLNQKRSDNVIDERLLQADSFLRTHLDSVQTIDDFARKFGFSRRNLDRNWQQTFHCTPWQSIHEYRLAEARRLLEETHLPVEQIAVRVGYQVTSYFIQVFQRHCGTTPGKYRRKTQEF